MEDHNALAALRQLHDDLKELTVIVKANGESSKTSFRLVELASQAIDRVFPFAGLVTYDVFWHLLFDT